MAPRRASSPPQRSAADHGFTPFEFVVVLALAGILATVIFQSLSGAAADASRTACVSDVAAVSSAEAAYVSQNTLVGQLTETQLVQAGGGSLMSWPTTVGDEFVLLIAGDRNDLVGVRDVRGHRVARNDLVLLVGH
ncbi:MAG TPA: hypothetical protein VKT18_07075, partial [Acidimicrobiales bacterium]|nr:hypothetical protein [Acidimicrobiales bacterium]